MNELAQTLLDGLLDIEEEVGATVTWAGTTCACTGGPQRRGKKVEIGGYTFDADLVVVVRCELLPGTPTTGQSIQFKATPDSTASTWKVDSVQNVWDALLVISCNQPQS